MGGLDLHPERLEDRKCKNYQHDADLDTHPGRPLRGKENDESEGAEYRHEHTENVAVADLDQAHDFAPERPRIVLGERFELGNERVVLTGVHLDCKIL